MKGREKTVQYIYEKEVPDKNLQVKVKKWKKLSKDKLVKAKRQLKILHKDLKKYKKKTK